MISRSIKYAALEIHPARQLPSLLEDVATLIGGRRTQNGYGN